jgi:hypothetical protein
MHRTSAVTLVIAGALSTAVPSNAYACGGCLHPPPGPVTGTYTVLSAHRMALSISSTETVLWDQITFTGDPQDFAWVLPVAGTPTVELADNGFFEGLSAETAIALTGPMDTGNAACPSAPRSMTPPTARVMGRAVGRGLDPDASSGTSILYQGVVGPYETRTIHSTTPDTLVDWLATVGYAVPEDARPVIRGFAERGLDFVVLRMRPGVGIEAMQPVRIRMPGLALSLPLQMVAVGADTTVELELFVLAESRMEVANFPNAEVDRSAISYDFGLRAFDYEARFEDALYSGTGTSTNWVTEVAGAAPLAAIASHLSTGPNGEIHSGADDVAVVRAGLATPYLTRLRSRPMRTELDRDLVLRLAPGADLGTAIAVTRSIPAPCAPIEAGTAFDAGPRVARPAHGSGCSLGAGRPAWSSVIVWMLATALVLRRRRGLRGAAWSASARGSHSPSRAALAEPSASSAG